MNQNTKSDQTKNAILDAANRILIEKGAECFTLESVAAEANVSKGGLLYHFRSKNELITGMICGYRVEEIADPLMKQIRYLDKLIDELAKGKSLEKILRA